MSTQNNIIIYNTADGEASVFLVAWERVKRVELACGTKRSTFGMWK